MTPEQVKKVEDNIGLVGKTILLKLRKWSYDEDIYQIGCMGLIDAVLQYTDGSVVFSTFASWKIYYTITNHLRKLNTVKRRSDLNTKSIYDKTTEGIDSYVYELISDHVDITEDVISNIILDEITNQLDCTDQIIFTMYIDKRSYREIGKAVYLSHEAVRLRLKNRIKPVVLQVVGIEESVEKSHSKCLMKSNNNG